MLDKQWMALISLTKDTGKFQLKTIRNQWALTLRHDGVSFRLENENDRYDDFAIFNDADDLESELQKHPRMRVILREMFTVYLRVAAESPSFIPTH